MEKKVLLILVDGMRPDSLQNIPFEKELLKTSNYTLKGRTVMPSVTLPCHMSLFHSVEPQRHGVVTNTYTPQVRPINGLCEQLKAAKKKCAFFYNWEELRDLARPESLACSFMLSLYTCEKSNEKITRAAQEYIKEGGPDFLFLYLGEADEVGHAHGWMGSEYLKSVKESWDCIRRIMTSLPEGYDTVITADHGGHDRNHGTDMPEDMTIPIIFHGPDFPAAKQLESASILDIAPTVAKVIGCETAPEWEGKSVI